MGFDRSLFLTEPNDDFICIVCDGVLDTPVSACTEGHTFCRKCLQKWADELRSKRKAITCPNCRAKLSSVEAASRNRIVENLVSAMPLRCEHAKAPTSEDDAARAKRQRSEGAADTACQWTGKQSELAAHLESCPHVPVACPHEGCDTRIARGQLTAHTKTCPRRPAKCQDCRQTMPHCELVSIHGDTCKRKLVPCPNCGRKLPREEIPGHRLVACPREPVACPFGAPLGPCPHVRAYRPHLA